MSQGGIVLDRPFWAKPPFSGGAGISVSGLKNATGDGYRCRSTTLHFSRSAKIGMRRSFFQSVLIGRLASSSRPRRAGWDFSPGSHPVSLPLPWRENGHPLPYLRGVPYRQRTKGSTRLGWMGRRRLPGRLRGRRKGHGGFPLFSWYSQTAIFSEKKHAVKPRGLRWFSWDTLHRGHSPAMEHPGLDTI